jgi:glycosyltransferase involved in cell wall biosynthesis
MVSDSRYDDFLARASVAVQLRDKTNGESSAAVADCLGAGVPVIVSDVGSFSELPDDAVLKVRRDITPHELADTISSLMDDVKRRAAMSAAGVAYAQRHSFSAAAQTLLDALERRSPSSRNS